MQHQLRSFKPIFEPVSYTPGLHIIAELAVAEAALLDTFGRVRECINGLILHHDLKNLGEVYHNFSPHGFTAVICLSESHLSLHSWPEYNRLHLDVYLSNFLRNNDSVTQDIFEALVRFFDASVINVQTLQR